MPPMEDDPDLWRKVSTVDEPDTDDDPRWSQNWAPISAEAEKHLFGEEDEGERFGPPVLMLIGMPLAMAAKVRAELDQLGLHWLKVVPCSAAMLSERTGDALRDAEEPKWAADLSAQMPTPAPARFESVLFSGTDSYEVAQLYQHLTSNGLEEFTVVRYLPELDGVPLADAIGGRLSEEAKTDAQKAEQWKAYTEGKAKLEVEGEYAEVPPRPLDPVGDDWAEKLVIEGDEAFFQPGHEYTQGDIERMIVEDLRKMGAEEDADLFEETAKHGKHPEIRRKGGRPSDEEVAEEAKRQQAEMVRLAELDGKAKWVDADLEKDDDEDAPLPGEEGYADYAYEKMIEQRMEDLTHEDEVMIAKMCMQDGSLAELDAMFANDPEWQVFKAEMAARPEASDREYLDLMSKLGAGVDMDKFEGLSSVGTPLPPKDESDFQSSL